MRRAEQNAARAARDRRLSQDQYDVEQQAFGGLYSRCSLRERDLKWLECSIDRNQLTLTEWQLQERALLGFTEQAGSATMARALKKCELHIKIQTLRLERLRNLLASLTTDRRPRGRKQIADAKLIEHQP